jgi:hypothetical protein
MDFGQNYLAEIEELESPFRGFIQFLGFFLFFKGFSYKKVWI